MRFSFYVRAAKHMTVVLCALCPFVAHAAGTVSRSMTVTVQIIAPIMPPAPVRDYYTAQPTTGIVYRTIEY